MPKRLWHDEDGNIGIIDSEVPAALADPLANLHAVYFHAAFDYLQIAYDETVTVNFPARGTGNSEFVHDVFPAHNLPSMPFGVLRIGAKQLPPGGILQGGTYDDMRCLFLEMDATKFYVREAWMCDDGNQTPAISVALRVIGYRIAPANTAPKKAHFTPADGRLRLGFGKFDTDNRYLRQNGAAAADFYMTAGRTIDTYRGTLRQVLPNGEVKDFGDYPGSFAGTGFWGVSD